MKSLVLGDLEQKILNILWEAKTALCVRKVLEALNDEYAYTTVMTVMSRMEKKNLLKRNYSNRCFSYTFTQDKSEFAKQHLQCLCQALVNNYGSIAISEFKNNINKWQKN